MPDVGQTWMTLTVDLTAVSGSRNFVSRNGMFTAAVTRCATPVSRLAELVASLHSES